MQELKKRILVLLSIIMIMIIITFFKNYFEEKNNLKIEELNEMVEKEIIEIYGKN
jgi:hypothetical protein